MPCAAHPAIKASGFEAPSRKLKAERAWSSMYISRTLPAPTTFPGERRRKRDRGLRHVETRKGSESRGPTLLPARAVLPTNRPTCARAPRRAPPCRASLERRLGLESFPATGPKRRAEAERRESLFAFRDSVLERER